MWLQLHHGSDEYRLFAQMVLGLGQQHGNMPSKCPFLNMLLADFLLIVNLAESFDLPEPNN